MRILVLCYEYPPLGGGGGRVAQSVARELSARGHEVRVQTAALGWRSIRETEERVDIFRSASGRRAPDTCSVPEMGLYCTTSFLPSLRHIREWKPDIIHAHFAVPTGLLAWAIHRLTGTPYVLTAHLGDVPGGVPEQTDTMFKLIGPLARQVWEHATAATAVSSFVQELAERSYHRPVERILNGIDLADQRPAPAPAGEPRSLVFVGRFNRQKNLPWLIKTLGSLAPRNWRATIVGDGPDRSIAEELVDRHGLRDRVILRGWLTAAEVARILSVADILCMPSLSEGMPLAAIEALKHGVAIMASDVPGVRDVVEHGVNGYCAPLNDSYAKCLQSLLEDGPILASMKQASWKKAASFDIRKIADQYEEILGRAAAGTD